MVLVQPDLTKVRTITPMKRINIAGLTGINGLAGAVVYQALQDANAGDLEAANWLGSDQAEMFYSPVGINRATVDMWLLKLLMGLNNGFRDFISSGC